MKQLTKFPDKELLSATGPFVTIYQNAHQTPLSTDNDKIQFKNLLKEAKEKLYAAYDEETADKISDQITDLSRDRSFFEGTSGSLFLIATPSECYYYILDTEGQDFAMVTEEPVVLPIIENFQFVQNYHLLCLNRDSIKLFKGRKKHLEPIELPDDAPVTLEKALGNDELTGGSVNFGNYGGLGGVGGQTGSAMFHGHHEKSAEKDKDRDNYFALVDHYIFEHYSEPTEMPLVVFALTENQAAFRQISKNPFLSDEEVDASPAQITNHEIEEEVKKAVDDLVYKRHVALIENYTETVPKFKLGSQYSDLSFASIEGRIGSLMIQKDHEVKGSIDENGQYVQSDEPAFLNKLALKVLQTDGTVYVLDKAQMPTPDEGVAAILRF